MSTRMTHYVMFGRKYDSPEDAWPEGVKDGDEFYQKYESMHDDAYSEEFDPSKLVMVADGMNGDYLMLGYVLAKGDEVNGIEMTAIESPSVKDMLLDLAEHHPELAFAKAGKFKIGLWAFTHWH